MARWSDSAGHFVRGTGVMSFEPVSTLGDLNAGNVHQIVAVLGGIVTFCFGVFGIKKAFEATLCHRSIDIVYLFCGVCLICCSGYLFSSIY